MFKNHFKTAFRSIQKRKGFALINIIGLSLGIWCTILISIWIFDEFDKDNFHVKGNRISQVLTRVSSMEDADNTWDGTGYPVAEALAAQIPEIETAVRITSTRGSNLQLDEKSRKIQIRGADSDFFNLFSFVLKEGQTDYCLKNLKSIVLSEELAANYFPRGNAMGQTVNLTLDEKSEPYRITGIFEKIPRQSTIKFDALVPLDNFLPMNNKSWGNTWVQTYVLQAENSDLDLLGQKVRKIPEKMGDDKWRTLVLQPLKDRYLYSKFVDGKAVGGRIDYVILFGIIALFTLLIACSNFINLTTAWAIKRSKEVGIKKVLGAGRGSLFSQFFMESVVLVCLSLLIAVSFAGISMPLFNTITEKDLSIDFLNTHFYGILLIIAIGTVLLSGVYPAFLLSSFKSTNALKEELQVNPNETRLRKGLVIFQFFLCMVMITGTLVVYFQLRYIQSKNLGLDKENVIYLPMDQETYLHSQAMKTELANFSGIEQVSLAGSNFSDMGGTTSDPVWEGMSPDTGQNWFSILDVDFELLDMLDIAIKDGRRFSPDFAIDTLNYIVNEEAVKAMGMKDPIGKSLSFWGEEGGKIVGVVNNFHFTSLHNPITPMIIRCRPKNTYLFYLKTKPSKAMDAIAHMQKIHEQFSGLPMEYHFLDEAIEKGYKNEKKVQQLAGGFAAIAIIISCLGLFGLAMFTAQQRVKEIAVRKVLGANITGLFQLLSKDFIKLVGLALLIAMPISWYLMNSWIQGFAFHIDIQWWMFVVAGVFLLTISLLTVSYQTLKIATTNPAKSLRTE
ncbi:ABC transporter permease [Maribacter litoralis]|uniref:ABC transporter permease n=1 Tax=Maribacter litoralis TaxID=2059726 RepID=UPI003F5CC036